MMTGVAQDPQAIGYISLGSLDDSVKALKVDGAEASELLLSELLSEDALSSVAVLSELLPESPEPQAAILNTIAPINTAANTFFFIIILAPCVCFLLS